jgi:hypothetical protein
MSDVISTGEKSGVKVEEYKGIYSLSAQQENNGKFWAQWAKYRKGKDGYQDKDWPIKVTLGDKETAAATLKMVYAEIMGVPIGDVPF